MSEAVNTLINRLVGRSPKLATLLREHRADNFGDILPHVFFGDLTRFVVREYCRITGERTVEESATTSELEGLLEELEDAFASGEDEEVCELIAVSFLENLPGRGEEGHGVRDLLGRSSGRRWRRSDSRIFSSVTTFFIHGDLGQASHPRNDIA